MAGTGPAGSRLVAMVQHPRCLFAYWELWEGDLAMVEEFPGCRRESLAFALRLFRLGVIGGGAGDDEVRTIPVDFASGSHYVYPVSPGRLYWLELGVLTGERGFIRLLRSEVVETPPAAAAAGPPAAEEEGAVHYSPLAAVSG